SGVLTPLEVLVQSGTARTAQHKLAAVPGIATVAAPTAADSNRSGTTVLIAIPNTANLNSSASTSVTEARNAVSGLPGVIGIAGWVPLMIFAFLFGLSMDYEVFILSRMREEYDRTGSTRHAVTEGLGRTGRLVTSAALILFFAFASLTSAPNTDIKVFATALGAGILLDATVVRALLVPAT